MRQTPGLMLSLALFSVLSSCPQPIPAPDPKTPILSDVLKPGPSLTTIGPDAAGSFELLPAPSAIVTFHAPFPTSFVIGVNGTTLEQTSDLGRQATLESQNLGYWFFYANGSMPNPQFGAGGDPIWWVVVAPQPSLRISSGFTITIADASNGQVSSALTVPISVGIPDWIALANNKSADNVAVLLDANRLSGCSQYELLRGVSFIDVGDVRAAGSCTSEIVAFSKDQAMILDSPERTWTDNLRDLVTIDLSSPSWQVPVTFWELVSPAADQNELATANQLYDSSRTGISFSGIFNNVSGNSTLIGLIGTDPSALCSGSWVSALQSSSFFVAGQINVYYITVPFTAFVGQTCPQNPRNIILIAPGEAATTLAHEFGHSLSLGHTNSLPGFGSDNLMWSGGSQTSGLTIGQAFRTNVNKTSSINMNGVRHGWLRDCPDSTVSDTCPDLTITAP